MKDTNIEYDAVEAVIDHATNKRILIKDQQDLYCVINQLVVA
jgi:hypothetical protein